MKKITNTFIKLGMSILTLCGTIGLSGCSETKEVPVNDINDNYRTMYQIFPISFADSNGDKKGDLRGIIDKLDYIRDMNYTGLWLTPIHKSPSYHKYDVEDYKSIDITFGTLQDYDDLVSKCHEYNMTILLDLVFNHTSSSHPWFIKACEARKKNQTANKYYNYYNFQTKEDGASVPQGWELVPGSSNIIYECRFFSGMPDLNLGAILEDENCELSKELEDIIKFWIVDHKVDGFRLDAVTSYFTGNTESNKKFLAWINKTTKKYNSKAYIVGEASWSADSGENKIYQESGVDSFFQFGNEGASGYVGATVKNQKAKYVYLGIKNNLDIAYTGIPAPFAANHDTGRLIGAVAGRSSSSNIKFGNGVLQMMCGTTFTYYGDEIGMAVSSNGLKNDPNKRTHMNWGDSYDCNDPEGTIKYSHDESYPYPTVSEQLKDKNSIVNYVKKVNLLRRQFPSIARGNVSLAYENLNGDLCVLKREYKEETIYVAINASNSKNVKFELDKITSDNINLVAEVAPSGNAKQNKKTIEIPSQGIAIIK